MIFDFVFLATFNFVRRYKWVVVCVLLIITLLSMFRIYSTHFKNDISLMLPDNQSAKRYLNVFRDSNIADKVIVSFSLKDDNYSMSNLFVAVDKFASTIKSPLITRVDSSFVSNSPFNDLKNLLKYAPQLISKRQLDKIGKKINPKGVNIALRQDYNRLIAPGSSFSVGLIRLDPLNIYSGIFSSLSQLTTSMGYSIIPKNNHLISKDMKHVMIILETSVPITDSSSSKLLLDYIDNHLHTIPSYVEATVICGHLHAASNEKIIKKDIQITLLISAVAFILLFTLILKKDLRCFIILLLPVIAGLISMTLLTFFIKQMSYFVLGMGGVITGIAIDYGIHVYVAVMHASETNAETVSNNVKHISRPVIIGGLTTIGIFLAFFFSNVPGYHQLAFFAIFSILISLVFALFILPQFLNIKKTVNLSFLNRLNPQKLTTKLPIASILIIVWLICILFLGFLASKQQINNDISQFDGSSPEIFQNEKDFHDIWGGSNMPAILVTSADSMNKLFELNEKLNSDITKVIDKKNYFNLVSIWPSVKSRTENLENWNKFWNKHEHKLKGLIDKCSLKYGFSKDAFNPFFNSINTYSKVTAFPTDNVMFESLARQFLYKKNDRFYMLSFFPDKINILNKVEQVCGNFSESFVVSREAFSGIISKSVSSEIYFLAIIAAVLIPLLALLLLRNIFRTLLALIPVISSLIAIGGILYLIDIPFSAPVIIAGLITVGLSIDYGVFMVYHNTSNSELGTFSAVTLSAVTTIIGAGAVIFAQHPLLFNIGTTLVIGICSGYLVSVLIVPSIITVIKLNRKGNNKKCILFFVFFSLFIVSGCRNIPFKETELVPLQIKAPEEIPLIFEQRMPEKFTLLNSLVFNYFWHSFSSLGVCKVDINTDSIIVVGMNQMGIKLFELSGKPGSVECNFAIEELKKYKKFPETVITDIHRVYFNQFSHLDANVVTSKYKICFVIPYQKGKIHYCFGGKDLCLLEKKYVENGDELWKVTFYEYTLINSKLFPKGIIFDNFEHDYQLVISLKEIIE